MTAELEGKEKIIGFLFRESTIDERYPLIISGGGRVKQGTKHLRVKFQAILHVFFNSDLLPSG